MYCDFVLNGQGHGEVGDMLTGVHFDPGLLRPFLVSNSGRNIPCAHVLTGRMIENHAAKPHEPKFIAERKTFALEELARQRGIYSPVGNATSLRKEEWIQLDMVVARAARERLRAWADLMAAAPFGGFNGMAKTTFEYEAMSDPGEAIVDMDGLSEGRGDSPLFKLRSMPLPITHASFSISDRRLATSRNSGTPLDTSMGEACGRRVGEMIEKTLIGVETGLTYGTQSTGVTAHDGNSTVYGYINYTNRLTKIDMTTPTGSNPEATVQDVLEAREQLYTGKFYGPYMIYHSTDWDQYLDNDYARLGGNNANMTLRDRLKAISGVQDVRRLDFLTAANSHAFTMIMVQMTPDVVRAINGMEVTTVQWESKGGLQKHFKVMAIQVPQIRADYSGNCGLLHARTA